MGSIFDEKTATLETWAKGEPLRAEKLNQPVHTMRRLVGGIKPPQQVMSTSAGTAAGSSSKIVRFKSIGYDVLICRDWNGEEEGTDDIRVALPPLLRRRVRDDQNATSGDYTTFDQDKVHNDIGYIYSDNEHREGTSIDDETEAQIIMPLYVENDLLVISQLINGVAMVVSVTGPFLFISVAAGYVNAVSDLVVDDIVDASWTDVNGAAFIRTGMAVVSIEEGSILITGGEGDELDANIGLLTLSIQPPVWQDMNIDGRRWCENI